MKTKISITTKDNDCYFDGKLSKRELINQSIERIVRDIKISNGVKSGAITRRNKQPLEVIKKGSEWRINGVLESEKQPKKHIERAKTDDTENIQMNWKTLKKISKLSEYEIYLLMVVKFDSKEGDQLISALRNNTARNLLDTIPKFKPGEKYTLLGEVFEIIEVNGNLVKYSGLDGIKRKHSKVDCVGEFLRPVKNKMEIIHSDDKPINEESQ